MAELHTSIGVQLLPRSTCDDLTHPHPSGADSAAPSFAIDAHG